MSAIARMLIRGRPVPKARARVVDGHAFTPKRTAEAEAYAAWAFKLQNMEWECDKESALHVSLLFSTHHRRTDADNLAKLVLDALNGVAYADDRQIASLYVTVIRSRQEDERTELDISKLFTPYDKWLHEDHDPERGK